MIRISLVCMAVLMSGMGKTIVVADDVVLTLDLHNNLRGNPQAGGDWQLFARKVETNKEPQGDSGITYIRALIENIDSDSVKFANDLGQMKTGGPFVKKLSDGTTEIVYQQDTAATVVKGIGVDENPNLDRLIASGIWQPGPRPKFGDIDAKPTPETSVAKFLATAKTPFPEAVTAGKTLTSVVTLGDLNENDAVTNADISLFVARLPGASPALPYHPAADLDQSGTIDETDRELLIAILSDP